MHHCLIKNENLHVMWAYLIWQVLKEIARSMGYAVKTAPRKRASWMNYKGHRLNMKKKTSSAVLKKLKRELIESDAIDIGDAIVPIEYDVIRVNADGSLVSYAELLTHHRFEKCVSYIILIIMKL